MKALRSYRLIVALSIVLTPACTPTSDGGGGLIDDLFNNPGQDGQQLDPILEATAGATAVATGDFNDDGYMDFVSVSSESQPVQLHLLNSQGAFDLLSIAGGGPLARMTDVAATDLNNDGRLDVAVLVGDTGFVAPEDVEVSAAIVLLIQGANPLDPSQWIWVQPADACYTTPDLDACGLFLPASKTGPTDLEVGDFNGDGLPDLAVASNQTVEDPRLPSTFVYVLLNPGPANVYNAALWTRTVADSEVQPYSDLAVADMDGDGDDDIVAAAPTGTTWNIRWLRNSGSGGSWTKCLVGEQFGGADRIDVGDINGDGSPDVVAAASAYSLIQWFRSPGPASLAAGIQVPWYVYNVGLVGEIEADDQEQTIDFNQVQVLDTDADGQMEVFATGSGVAYEFQRTENLFNPWSGTALFKADPEGTLGRCGFYNYGGSGVLDIIVPVDRAGLLLDGFYLFVR